jgi:ubiquitin carboxyl-terminal hydrolase 25/28
MRILDGDWTTLGLTPTSYTPGILTILRVDTFSLKFRVDLLIFAYLAQCRCDPAGTMDYFTALVRIVQAMKMMNEDTPMDLENLALKERVRNRFTRDDLLKAVGTLGFGRDGPLKVNFDESVEEEFVINAWRDGIRRSWKDEMNGPTTRRELNDALRVIAGVRGSAMMYHVLVHEKGSIMTADTAYSTLGVPKETDGSTLITVFNMRVSEALSRGFLIPTVSKVKEQASQAGKLREALSVIAEVTQSQRLRVFLEAGRDRKSDTTSIASRDSDRIF